MMNEINKKNNKIIIDQKILGPHFISVAYDHADKLCDIKRLNKKEVSKRLNSAIGPEDFLRIYEEYFGDEIKLIL